MRAILLSLLIATIMLATGAAQSQPVMLEAKPLLEDSQAPAEPKATAPVALPDLTPDTIVKSAPAYQAPEDAGKYGDSTIIPSMEPWQTAPVKRRSGKTADEIFLTLPAEIQTLILDETYTVNQQCHQYNMYSQFHDCECLGSRYFEERVFTPEESRDTLVAQLSSECTSIPGVAGYGYDQCLSSMSNMLVPGRITDFCTCFANQLAQGYKMSPYPDFGNLRGLGSQANTYCLQRVPSSIKVYLKNIQNMSAL